MSGNTSIPSSSLNNSKNSLSSSSYSRLNDDPDKNSNNNNNLKTSNANNNGNIINTRTSFKQDDIRGSSSTTSNSNGGSATGMRVSVEHITANIRTSNKDIRASIIQQLNDTQYDNIINVEFPNTTTTAKCVIVNLDLSERHVNRVVQKYFHENSTFIDTHKKPGAIISVTGGAKYYEIRSVKLERLLKRGFLRAAHNLGAWIVDGGMDTGVMKYIGESIKSMSVTHIPCIGIATFKKVNNYDSLKKASEEEIKYETIETDDQSCGLNPNHTHFVLVDSGKDQMEWGEEIVMLNAVQKKLAETTPIVIISFNGGKGTLDIIAKGLENNLFVIVIQGTGRVSDAIAALVSLSNKYDKPVVTCTELEKRSPTDTLQPWNTFLQEFKRWPETRKIVREEMDTVLRYRHRVVLFDPDDEDSEGLDVIILRKVVAQEKSILKKINHCIAWGDKCDIIQEILDDAAKDIDAETNQEVTATKKAELTTDINLALAEALWLNRSNIFALLCDHHATFTHPLRYMYRHPLVLEQLHRGHVWLFRGWEMWPNRIRDMWTGWLRSFFIKLENSIWSDSDRVDTQPRLELILTASKRRAFILGIFQAIQKALQYSRRFYILHTAYITTTPFDCVKPEYEKCIFTDLLIWSVFVNRIDLAKQIWRRTTYPVHSALLACNLYLVVPQKNCSSFIDNIYRYLSRKAARSQEYLDNSAWFEQQASGIMTLLDYHEAEKLLQYEWESVTGQRVILEDIAQDGSCKEFISHPHFQQLLDEVLYSHQGRTITTSKSNAQIIFTIVTAFILWVPLTIKNWRKARERAQSTTVMRSAVQDLQSVVDDKEKAQAGRDADEDVEEGEDDAQQADITAINVSPAPPPQLSIPSLALNQSSTAASRAKNRNTVVLSTAPVPRTNRLLLPSRNYINLKPLLADDSSSTPTNPQGRLLQTDGANSKQAEDRVLAQQQRENQKLDEEEQRESKDKEDDPFSQDSLLSIYPPIYFNIPIVKFWTNSMFYIAFLILQAYVLLIIRSEEFQIPELVLWLWILCFFIEEVKEFHAEHVLHLTYFGLRISSYITTESRQFHGALNTLIVACVVSWLRLMAIFPVSATFGPLFFIISQLFTRDFVLWTVLFAIFAVSFQIGFSSLAIQGGFDPMTFYPSENGTFPISYFSIIGEFSYLMPAMSHTAIGVAFLAIYTFIAQVMLVNLLIAMMGDTYTTVRQNSDVEWKFYRRVFVHDNIALSAFPPPLNLIGYAYRTLRKLGAAICSGDETSGTLTAMTARKLSFLRSQSPPSIEMTPNAQSLDPRSESRASITVSGGTSPLLTSRKLSRYHLHQQLVDEDSEEAEDMTKVMRVTLDKIAEKGEKEDSESPLAQIIQTKRAVQLEANHKKNMETKIDTTSARLDSIDRSMGNLFEMINDGQADQKLLEKKVGAVEKKLSEVNANLVSLLAVLASKSNNTTSNT